MIFDLQPSLDPWLLGKPKLRPICGINLVYMGMNYPKSAQKCAFLEFKGLELTDNALGAIGDYAYVKIWSILDKFISVNLFPLGRYHWVHGL